MSDYTGAVDERHEIALPSSIERVQWTRHRVSPGGRAGLKVFTRYVGNGATLQIELFDHQGTRFGTFQDQLFGNRLTAEITAPPKSKEALFAEVRFPEHGLDEVSPPLFLTPVVTVTDARWSTDEAWRGDIVTLEAVVTGVPDGTTARIAIFEYDDEDAHLPVTRFEATVVEEKISTEWLFEYQDDTGDIPTDVEVEAGYAPPCYFFRVQVEGVIAESDRLTFRDWAEFSFVDRFGRPRTTIKSVTFQLPDGSKVEKEPDDEGRVVVEDVPPGAVKVVDIEVE